MEEPRLRVPPALLEIPGGDAAAARGHGERRRPGRRKPPRPPEQSEARGYNREGVMRMIFPISNEVQFYVYGRGKALEVARVTEALSRVLQKYRLKHTIEWDQLKLLADKKE